MWLAMASQADDEHRARGVADRLGVMGHEAVPPKVVARPELRDMLPLGHPEAACSDVVVLVPGVAMDAGPMSRFHGDLDDRDVARAARVDPARATATSLAPAAVRQARHLRRAGLVDEEPGDRDIESR